MLAEPKQGLFGRLRGEARVRARVRPAPVRPKQERRRGRKGAPATATTDGNGDSDATEATTETGAEPREAAAPRGRSARRPRSDRPTPAVDDDNGERTTTDSPGGTDMTTDERPTDAEPVVSEADVESVRAAAVDFVGGLTTAFGLESTVTRPSRAVRSTCASMAARWASSSGLAAARCWRSRTWPASRPSGGSAITTRACASTWPAIARSAARRWSASPPPSPSRSSPAASRGRSIRCRRPTARSSTMRWPRSMGSPAGPRVRTPTVAWSLPPT